MGTLTIRLFGGLVLERDGQMLPAPTPQKAALLLAYLLTAYNRSHPRSLLAGLFWGDLPEQRARRNLSDAVWRIRNLLELESTAAEGSTPVAPPVLLFEGDGARFNPDSAVQLDVRQFEALLADPGNLAGLEEASELYRGDLLFGYYDDWILLERERLRQLYLSCLNRLIPAYKARGAWDAAVHAAQRLVQADPYQEEAARELMRLYYRQGRRDRALHQFAILKATLETELGLDPEPETIALYQLMQAGQVIGAQDAPAPAAPATAPRRMTGMAGAPLGTSALQAMSSLRDNLRTVPLVGRQTEQEVLAAWLASPRPQPPMLLIQGEAGIGKTRLAQDTVEEAYRHRMFVLWGHYHPLVAPLPYGGLVEALRMGLQLGGPPALEPIWLSEVSRLLPELADLYPGLPPPISLPPDQERTRLWEAFTRYLLALAASGPHMFVLEDVQWVDTATLDLLQYALLRLRSSGVGLRLLATARSEDLARTPSLSATLNGLEAQGILDYLSLDRLSKEAVGELVQKALSLPRPAPLFSSNLWRETEGNPFFALETIRFWTEQGALVRTGEGDWEAPGVDKDYARLPTPDSVRRVLEQRLARLSPAALSVIEVGAVIGREVPERLLWRSSGTTADAVLGPAEELLRHQLWIEAPSGQGYEFAHRKVVEVAYSGISGPRRRHLHRLAATALESEQPTAVEQLAHHWWAAEDPVRALPYLSQAGEHAAATFAHAAALVFFDQAVQAIDKLSASESVPLFDLVYSVLAGRGMLHIQLRHMDQARSDFDRLVELARGADQPGRIAEALAQRSGLAITQSRYTEALADLHEALDLAQTHENTLARARILFQMLRAHYNLGDNTAAIAAGERALAAYRKISNPRGEVEVLALLGAVYGLAGDRERGVAILEEAQEKVRLLPNSQNLEARILNNLSFFVPSPQTSLDLFVRSLEVAEQTRMLGTKATALYNLAELYTRFGQPAKALEYLQLAYELNEIAGDRQGQGMLMDTRGLARAMLGDLAAARADLREAVRILDSLGSRTESMWAYLDLGDYLLDQGEFEAGLKQIEHAYQLWQEAGEPDGPYRGVVYHAQMARAHMGLRRHGQARRAVGHALAGLDEIRKQPAIWTDPSVQVLAHCYSVLTGIGRSSEAEAALEEGYRLMMEMAERCGPELRASYLEGVHECRLLRAAWLKRQTTPSGNGHDPASPAEDAEAKRKTARRRAELRLMLRDAAGRGHVLNEDDLAHKFGVVRRTIQRDLAVLRQAGEIE